MFGRGLAGAPRQGHTFEKGRLALVCGNSAAMAGEGGVSWLAKHFQIIGCGDDP